MALAHGYSPAMRVTGNTVTRSCAVCERTLLTGERAVRFSPDGDGEFVDVCPLCHEVALDHGWVKEGSPTTPTVPFARRRRRGLGALFERAPAVEPVSPHRRRDREEPRRAAREHRVALGCEPRARDHDRLGHLVVPVPRQLRLGPADPPRRAGPRARRARVVLHGVERTSYARRPGSAGDRALLKRPLPKSNS